MDWDWLKAEFCARPNKWDNELQWRSNIARLDDWTIALDRCHMVAIRGELAPGADPVPDQDFVSTIRGWITFQLQHEIDAAALMRWAGKFEPTVIRRGGPCRECAGLGRIECACACGGRSHEVDCAECDGTGKDDEERQVVPAIRPGRLFGVLLNLNLLALVLRIFDQARPVCVGVEPEKRVIYLGQADRRGVIAGLWDDSLGARSAFPPEVPHA